MQPMIVLAWLVACSGAHAPVVIENVAPPAAPDHAYPGRRTGPVQ